MDVKALAKSKRAHTQHHSKRPHGPHANQNPKTLSDGSNASGSVKKPLGKQVVAKSHQPRGLSKLPTNWDRYEEEFEDPSVSDGASQPSEVILPKSKGADYRQLIAEAQSQSSLYLDSFPSMDDLMPGEFNQGLGPMLSVRGEGILSWIGGDNFVVEDKTAATHEASFLSLNLHALAEKLANIDLSQRLFIEADLLLPELCTEGLKTSSSVESEQTKTRNSDVATTTSKDFSEKVKITDQNPKRTSVGSTGSIDADQTLPRQGSVSLNAVNVDLRQGSKSSQSERPQSAEESKLSSALDPQKRASTFEAAAAEEELDVLLDSFSESKNIASPSGTRSNYAYPGLKQEASVPAVPGSSSKTSPVTADLDDALDNLLEETSTVMNQNCSSQPLKGKSALPVVQSSSSNSGTKSQLLDDFDSWLDTI